MMVVLFELATSYKLTNPIREVVPDSHFGINTEIVDSDHEIDIKITGEYSQWMKTATGYVKECITPVDTN